MILQLGKIQASVKKHLVPKIKAMVDEGCAYDVENALVAHNDPKYQCIDHRFKLNLIEKTKFIKVEATKIPDNYFDFVSSRDILEVDREDKHLGKLPLPFSMQLYIRSLVY